MAQFIEKWVKFKLKWGHRVNFWASVSLRNGSKIILSSWKQAVAEKAVIAAVNKYACSMPIYCFLLKAPPSSSSQLPQLILSFLLLYSLSSSRRRLSSEVSDEHANCSALTMRSIPTNRPLSWVLWGLLSFWNKTETLKKFLWELFEPLSRKSF